MYSLKRSIQGVQPSASPRVAVTRGNLARYHGALKRVIKPTRGFQSMKTAIATIKGFEIMRMIRRGHCLTCKKGVRNEIRFVNQLLQVAA